MRKTSLSLVLCVVTLCACPSHHGPQPNVLYFWHVLTSALSFGSCSDQTDFRASVKPFPAGDNTYITYKVSSDAKSAVAMDCTRLDATTCTPTADGGVVFTIAGSELTHTETATQPITSSTCSLQQDETWTFRDQNSKFDLEIDSVLSLTGPKAECDQVEAGLKAQAPNKLGVAGCVLTFNLTGELK